MKERVKPIYSAHPSYSFRYLYWSDKHMQWVHTCEWTVPLCMGPSLFLTCPPPQVPFSGFPSFFSLFTEILYFCVLFLTLSLLTGKMFENYNFFLHRARCYYFLNTENHFTTLTIEDLGLFWPHFQEDLEFSAKIT